MIVVDSSVWIAKLRGIDRPSVRRLDAAADMEEILVGDLILLEVLQGARSQGHAAHIESLMRRFEVVSMLDDRLAAIAAAHYRHLRARGATVRKLADTIIASFCIDGSHALLHDDRDFEPFVTHLGLKEA